MPQTRAEMLANLAKARAVKAMKTGRGTGIMDTIKSGLTKAKDYIKSKKVISTLLGDAANMMGPGITSTLLRYGQNKAKESGYGMRSALSKGQIPATGMRIRVRKNKK